MHESCTPLAYNATPFVLNLFAFCMELILDETKKDTGHQAAASDSAEVEKLRRRVTYSISQIISFVNNKDVLRYLPDDMLSDMQKKAKWEAIAETVERTNDKNDKKYIQYIEKGNLMSAKQMVIAAAIIIFI